MEAASSSVANGLSDKGTASSSDKRGDAYTKDQGPDLDAFASMETSLLEEMFPIDERAIGAVEISYEELFAADDKRTMPAADSATLRTKLAGGVPPERS